MTTLIYLIIYLFIPCIFSAAPVFHALIAQKWLDTFEHYSEKDKQAFILGTLFPDIRHQEHIDRNLTHEYFVTIEDLKKTKDPFYKGMRLHSFVDETRKNYVKKHKILDHVKNYPGDRQLFLKLIEDEILFSLYQANKLIYMRHYLDFIDIRELKFNISYSSVKKWHDHLSFSFRYPPSLYLRIFLLDQNDNQGFKKKTCIENIEHIPNYKNQAAITEYVQAIFSFYDHLFEKNR